MKGIPINTHQYSFKEVKKAIDKFSEVDLDYNQSRHPTQEIIFDGRKVFINETFKLFLKKGNQCVHCKITGDLVKIERDSVEATKNPELPYHFKLYHVTKEGDMIMMTKDHIIPASISHDHTTKNLQVMCEICNIKKADEEEVNPDRKAYENDSNKDKHLSKAVPLLVRANSFWGKLAGGHITYEKFMHLINNGYFQDDTKANLLKPVKIRNKATDKQLEIINDIICRIFSQFQSFSHDVMKEYIIVEGGVLKGFKSVKDNVEMMLTSRDFITIKCPTKQNKDIIQEHKIPYSYLTPKNKDLIYATRSFVRKIIISENKNPETEKEYHNNNGAIYGAGKLLNRLTKR